MTTTETLADAVSPPEAGPPASPWPQTLVGVGVLLTGLGLGFGATGISSDAGYGGVGPNFLPWVVAIALTLCGGFIVATSGAETTKGRNPEEFRPCLSG